MAAFYGEQATLREAGTTVDASMSGGQVHAIVDEYVTTGAETYGDWFYYGGAHVPTASTIVDVWCSNDVFGTSSNVINAPKVLSNGLGYSIMNAGLVGNVASVVRPTYTELPISVVDATANGSEGFIYAYYATGGSTTAAKSLVTCVFYVTGA